MTNEEAFEKFYKTITPAVPNAGYEDITKDAAYLSWQAAIAYMQEQSEPVAYGVMMPDGRIDKSDEPFYFADEIERKLANCIEGCTIAKLYTTPQRQQPLKRLDEITIDEIFSTYTDEQGYVAIDDWHLLTNAIMDAMQEINK